MNIQELKEKYNITKGLVIKPIWADKILYDNKTWEMRTRATSVRGNVAIIKSGTKEIFGVMCIEDSPAALTRREILSSYPMHKIDIDLYDDPEYFKWCFPWMIKNIVVLDEPIPYDHPQGAVVWVNL